MGKRQSPGKRRSRPVGGDAFSKSFGAVKNQFPPLDVQAAGRRANDKPQKPPRGRGQIESEPG